MKTVAMIGTGIMGRGMAENLHKAGHFLRLYARNPARIADLKKERMEIFSGPSATVIEEAARGVDLAVLCLTEDDVVRTAFFGDGSGVEDGGLLRAHPSTIVDTGTTSPELTKEMAAACRKAGIAFLDAPMTGSKNAAKAGQILFMVGGADRDFENVKFFFEACGKLSVRCGATGFGQRTKIALNLIQAGMFQVYLEGFLLAKKDGVPAATLMEVLKNSAAASPLLDFKLDCVRRRDFDPHFSLKNMNKDVNHAMHRVHSLHAVLPLSQSLKAIYEAGMAAGYGESDFCSLAKVNEALNREEIR